MVIVPEVVCEKTRDVGMLDQKPGGPEDSLHSLALWEASLHASQVGRRILVVSTSYYLYDKRQAYPHLIITMQRGFRITNKYSERCLCCFDSAIGARNLQQGDVDP